jgi:hypothetical protein
MSLLRSWGQADAVISHVQVLKPQAAAVLLYELAPRRDLVTHQ